MRTSSTTSATSSPPRPHRPRPRRRLRGGGAEPAAGAVGPAAAAAVGRPEEAGAVARPPRSGRTVRSPPPSTRGTAGRGGRRGRDRGRRRSASRRPGTSSGAHTGRRIGASSPPSMASTWVSRQEEGRGGDHPVTVTVGGDGDGPPASRWPSGGRVVNLARGVRARTTRARRGQPPGSGCAPGAARGPRPRRRPHRVRGRSARDRQARPMAARCAGRRRSCPGSAPDAAPTADGAVVLVGEVAPLTRAASLPRPRGRPPDPRPRAGLLVGHDLLRRQLRGREGGALLDGEVEQARSCRAGAGR